MKPLTEDEIDEILEQFIARYLRAVGPDADVALRLALDRAREFLREHADTDFESADDFADRLLEAVEHGYRSGWQSPRAIGAVRRASREIYEFYRLKDPSPFGESSPVRLRLGGPDTRSIRFIGELDHFYFSKFANNTSEPLRKFFVQRYLENGAALFGRETSEELDDFRRAAGAKLENLSDRQIKTIVQTATARIRNWAHIGSLDQARIKLARVVATLDSRTTEICRELDGKLIRVGVAHKTIQRLNRMEPGEFAAELYESPIGKAISKEPVKTIQSFLEKDGKTIGDDLVKLGRGFPPYHANCRTRLEGVIAGVEDE
ncbi:MAG: hypothetical protein IPN69_08205 [Acidobacteria bacterium]|nr:hypothetical protein [Acidobacteriota bacterium]